MSHIYINSEYQKSHGIVKKLSCLAVQRMRSRVVVDLGYVGGCLTYGVAPYSHQGGEGLAPILQGAHYGCLHSKDL